MFDVAQIGGGVSVGAEDVSSPASCSRNSLKGLGPVIHHLAELRGMTPHQHGVRRHTMGHTVATVLYHRIRR